MRKRVTLLGLAAVAALGLGGCVAYPAGPGYYDDAPGYYAPGYYSGYGYGYSPTYYSGAVVYYDHGRRYYGPPRGHSEGHWDDGRRDNYHADHRDNYHDSHRVNDRGGDRANYHGGNGRHGDRRDDWDDRHH